MDDSPTAIHRILPNEFVVLKSDRIWQEFRCHESGMVFDRLDDELLVVGQRFECIGCRSWHTAGVDGPTQTLVARPDGALEQRSLPADAAERRAWLAEAAIWNDPSSE